MNTEKFIPLVKGVIKHLPGIQSLIPKFTGGTDNSRYCYAVWMRHLKFFSSSNRDFPVTIAELGPGDSLGMGLAGLLAGSERYYGLDVVKYWDIKRNLKIFDELIELYRQRAPIPDHHEFPLVKPVLDDYSFPSHVITEERLKKALAPERLAAIRKELENIDSTDNVHIQYHIPWYDARVIQNNTVDFIFSQAVLEHVEDLENTYNAMGKWLKPDGLMSHQIDFKSHGITKSWNGHWTFSDREWKIVRGGKDFYINREPFSTHLRLIDKYGFRVLDKVFVNAESQIKNEYLSERFKTLTPEDLSISGMFVLAEKKGQGR